MSSAPLSALKDELASVSAIRQVGRVVRAGHGIVRATGLFESAALGDHVWIESRPERLRGEVIELSGELVTILPDGPGDGVRIGDAVVLEGAPSIAPSESWIGRIIDAHGVPLDGRSLPRGPIKQPVRATAPLATGRRRLGNRLATSLCVFDTLLPIVRGQRIGLFSGSGVGKSMLLGQLARGIEADVVVIALAGERGREVREFVETTLGEEGRKRAVVIAATSDQPPLSRRRALWTAMSVAEFFRDLGLHVLLLADSLTRFAEAHREIALAAGEAASLRGYPPSTAHLLMSLAERAGPGRADGVGDITAIFSVLVAGSDMNEPVADIVRGVLDGHVVLSREIAERGRFPAIDILRSVSRSLPDAASVQENSLIQLARRRLGAYDRAELMIQSGLYASGSDPEIDAAIAVWSDLDDYVSLPSPDGPTTAFAELDRRLRQEDGDEAAAPEGGGDAGQEALARDLPK